MNYQIVGLSPRLDLTLGGWGFVIRLFPDFKKAVKKSGITSENAHRAIKNMGRGWLDGCGFNQLYDPDQNSFERRNNKPPGPNAKPLYDPGMDLRITWGEWGLEHITVPGNACGLDISEGIMAPRNGRILSPHNIDSMRQAMLFLVVFTWFAESIHSSTEWR